jgi:trehalose 6-phosphate synthase
VRAFPISIDFDGHARAVSSASTEQATAVWRKELGELPELLGIGIDRVDYTKGIPERLAAIDRLLEERPEYVGRLTFLQVGVPSRTAIADYDSLNHALERQVQALNQKWAHGTWRPVVFVHRHVPQHELMALHLMADFCVVSSLHDGMNLVAKEFVASRYDGDGVLVLSEFTGAARELTEALMVNPFSVEEIAGAIERALEMPAIERRRRMNRMRSVVEANNIYRWAGRVLLALSEIENASEARETETASHLLAGVA